MRRKKKNGNPLSLFSFQDIITGLCGILIFLVLIMIVDLISHRGASSVPDLDSMARETTYLEIEKDINRLDRELEEINGKLRCAQVHVEQSLSADQQERFQKELSDREQKLSKATDELEILQKELKEALSNSERSKQEVKELEKIHQRLEDKRFEWTGRKGITLIPERGISKTPVFFICGGETIECVRDIDGKFERERFPVSAHSERVSRILSLLNATSHTVVLIVRPSGADYMDQLANMVKQQGFTVGRDPLEEGMDVIFSKQSEETK